MAGHGPAPKDPSKRRRRNADPVPTTQLVGDGRVRGPRLPTDVLPDGEDWHARTKEWYDTWRRSPQAMEFTTTDWQFLIDTALMHHVMWMKGRWEFAAEIRLRSAKLGATKEDRARLRISIETAGKPRPVRNNTTMGTVTDIASRRKRLAEE